MKETESESTKKREPSKECKVFGVNRERNVKKKGAINDTKGSVICIH
jgi:hypothetical protein